MPRFAGPATFARLPRIDQVAAADVAVLGVPFDAGVSYRPGARFGPEAIRQGSKLLRNYHPALDVQPFASQQVADAGDVACNPFDIAESLAAIEAGVTSLHGTGARVVALGGDHTIALALLRATSRRHGPVALVHFDAHLDTWDTYFGEAYTHGTPFRRAAEEGLLVPGASVHVGVRGPLYAPEDLTDDEALGFGILGADRVDDLGTAGMIEAIRARVGAHPVYVSVDIDVMDPAFAPGTGTPEVGGLSSRELLVLLRGLKGLDIVGADVVEVTPVYDHAEITAVAAAHVVYDLISLMAPASAQITPLPDRAPLLATP